MAQDIAYQSAVRRSAVPVSETSPLPVVLTNLTAAGLVKSTVTLSGGSAELVPADPARRVVIVCSARANADAAIDPTGGVCALDAGIPLSGGDTLQITGKEAQSAMTQIGTSGQKLTVYVGA
jgi:hypothetical protein